MADLSGRCMCGQVTWRYRGDITRSLVCHCADCQRATSSPFTAFVGLVPGAVRWAGEINHYESSPGTYRGFCPACGARLYFRSEKWPGEVHIHAATLDVPGAYQPTAQVVMGSRRAWLDRLDKVEAFEGFHQHPGAADP